MSDTHETFTRQLVALREAAGLSQYELARRSGLTKQAISRLEQGNQGPAWETVQRLALALGVDCRAFADPALQLPADTEPKRRGRPPKSAAEPARPARRGRKEKE
jgi:transcriptional regulator with XRE-family HTH domain